MTDITWQPVTVALSSLTPWERNPKRISKAHAQRLLDLWQRLGQFQTIAIGPGGEVYDGHQRLSVLKAAHGARFEVQALQASRALSEKEREELTIAAHVGTTGSFDWDALSGWDAGDLQAWGFDNETLTNWQTDIGALRTMLDAESAPVGDDPGAQVDKAAELQAKWGTCTGQLWQLGEHRLVCGDCTDAEVVARVMGGERAQVLFTSPPYAQQRTYTDDSDVSDWDGLMRGSFGAAICADDCQVLVNLGLVHRDGEWWPYWDGWIEWMRQQGWRRFGWYVWDKLAGMPGDWGGRFAPAHEWIFHFCRRPQKPRKTTPTINAGKIVYARTRQSDGSLKVHTGYGEKVQELKIPDSVIRRGAMKGHDIAHPAVMPSVVAQDVIGAFDGIVYEPFLGSGTTLIACENLGRRCRAVEIAPGYVAVALERWHDMTGLDPVLLDTTVAGNL